MPQETKPLYLGARIHAHLDRFGQMVLTEHNGRAIVTTIRIPRDGIKSLASLCGQADWFFNKKDET